MTDASDAPVSVPGLSGAIDPQATYQVELARPAAARGVRFRPRGDLTLRGDLLLALITENGADAVLSAQPR